MNLTSNPFEMKVKICDVQGENHLILDPEQTLYCTLFLYEF